MAGLSSAPVVAVLRAENLERAKKFYTDVLGLEEDTSLSGQGMAFFSAGMGSQFTIYERPGMPAPQNTTLAFPVATEAFDAIADELRGTGVVFEEYDIPQIGLKTVNGVAVMDGIKSAWFKDPEGNIVNLVSM